MHLTNWLTRPVGFAHAQPTRSGYQHVGLLNQKELPKGPKNQILEK